MDAEYNKVLVLVGVIPPYTCEDDFSEKMLEFYLLKAKDALPDLQWQIKEIKKTNDEQIE